MLTHEDTEYFVNWATPKLSRSRNLDFQKYGKTEKEKKVIVQFTFYIIIIIDKVSISPPPPPPQ